MHKQYKNVGDALILKNFQTKHIVYTRPNVQTPENTIFWLLGDYISDLVFWLDMVVIKPRILFLDRQAPSSKYSSPNYFVSNLSFFVLILWLIFFTLVSFYPDEDRDGIYETDRKLCTRNYVKDGDFKWVKISFTFLLKNQIRDCSPHSGLTWRPWFRLTFSTSSLGSMEQPQF